MGKNFLFFHSFLTVEMFISHSLSLCMIFACDVDISAALQFLIISSRVIPSFLSRLSCILLFLNPVITMSANREFCNVPSSQSLPIFSKSSHLCQIVVKVLAFFLAIGEKLISTKRIFSWLCNLQISLLSLYNLTCLLQHQILRYYTFA